MARDVAKKARAERNFHPNVMRLQIAMNTLANYNNTKLLLQSNKNFINKLSNANKQKLKNSFPDSFKTL